MSGSIVRFSFAEAALKDRDLNDQNFVFDSSENDPNFTNFERRFYRQQFSFLLIAWYFV